MNPTEYKPELIQEFISLMESRSINTRSLHEELSSHAYRFRNPEAFIVKCFIHYSATGNTGKSFLAAALGAMYQTQGHSFANTAVVPKQLEEDQFNNWTFEKLMLHVEEAETDNYQRHNLDSIVKRITTLNGSGRAMYQETQDKRHWAMFGMNSNKSDLYGMIRGDEALISRLVILHFKPRGDFDWQGSAVADHFIKDPCFAYSFKRYLETEYVIPDDFTTDRYYGKDKDEFIAEALSHNKTTVDEWLELLNISPDTILQDTTFKKVPYKYIVKNEAYKHYDRNSRSGAQKYNVQNFMKALKDKGFVEIKTRIQGAQYVILRMEAAKWESMMNTNDPVEFEENDNEIATDCT
jgi:hypothetical protein